jgi:hypothetical protein
MACEPNGKFPNGARVRTKVSSDAGHPAGSTGTVVGQTMWFNSKVDPGDRVIQMDADGQRMCYESYFLEEL